MEVYFLRHAHAEYSDGILPDADRQLTEKGVRHTRRMSRLLKLLEIEPDRLFSSPLIRAQQTAAIVGTALGITVETRHELSPGFSRAVLETLVRDFGADDSLMIVGHEPDFSRVIADLIGGGRVVMKKGGLARVDIAAYNPLRGDLIMVVTPKVFERLG